MKRRDGALDRGEDMPRRLREARRVRVVFQNLHRIPAVW